MVEQMFGVRTESLISSLSRMERDMAILGDRYARDTSMVREDLVPEGWLPEELPDQKGFHDTMAWLGGRSAWVIANRSHIPKSEPVTMFGKKLLKSRSVGEVPLFSADGICHELEPRLMRSLRYHTSDNNLREGIGSAAVIILGEGDKPVGYEKSSGAHSTYLWEDTTLPTAKGKLTVSSDSFAYTDFSGEVFDEWPREHRGIVAVRASADTINMFGLARTSAVTYPPTVRRAMAHAAAMAVPKLAQNIEAALRFKPSDIERKVCSLMTSGMVPIIG